MSAARAGDLGRGSPGSLTLSIRVSSARLDPVPVAVDDPELEIAQLEDSVPVQIVKTQSARARLEPEPNLFVGPRQLIEPAAEHPAILNRPGFDGGSNT